MYTFTLTDPKFLPHTGCEVSFAQSPGEGLIIVGENGIGKTTLMRRMVENSSFSKSFIEQKNLDLFYDRSLARCREILTLVAGSELDLSIFENLWRTFGLHEKEGRLLSELSGGEGQIFKIICGLSMKAQVYFLDEPTQYLDEKRKNLLAQVLREIITKGKFVVLIEHDLSWLDKGYRVSELKILNKTLRESKQWII